MQNEPLVSVIMNCYNGEEYLCEAIDSVINQTYKNWEIIFWDNQSTDRSAEIFKEYNDKRLKYYLAPSHANILYEARNYALKKVSGDFIAFLDVDDWWGENKLEKQIVLFDDDKIGLVYGNCWLFYQRTKKKKIFKRRLPSGMIVNNLLNEYVIGSATYVIRKKFLDEGKYCFDGNFHIIGDFDLNVRLASQFQVNCLQEPVAFARRHERNVSLLNANRDIDELKIWYDKHKNNSIFSSKNSLHKFYLNILYLEIYRNLLNNKFRKNFLKIIKYPISIKKIKLIVALLLPKFILKKIQTY